MWFAVPQRRRPGCRLTANTTLGASTYPWIRCAQLTVVVDVDCPSAVAERCPVARLVLNWILCWMVLWPMTFVPDPGRSTTVGC